MKPIFLLLTALLATAGCSTIDRLAFSSKPNSEIKANQVLKSKWSGKQADDFFAKVGAPVNQLVNSSGQLIYIWSKKETLGTSVLYCDVKIVADAKGRIADIQVIAVTSGIKSNDYCDDISW
jgi:multidrug efflux pump subunit AcrB